MASKRRIGLRIGGKAQACPARIDQRIIAFGLIGRAINESSTSLILPCLLASPLLFYVNSLSTYEVIADTEKGSRRMGA